LKDLLIVHDRSWSGVVDMNQLKCRYPVCTT